MTRRDNKTVDSPGNPQPRDAGSAGRISLRRASVSRWNDDGGHPLHLPATTFSHATAREPFWSVLTTLDISVKGGPSC
jgi:hypothetical protein